MKDRIIKFLSSENKTSAQFAEEIGVQPSGVSHILSGRNNPSLDFVLKMLGRYTYISPEWLLFGKLPMHRGNANPTLFDMVDQEQTTVLDTETIIESGPQSPDIPSDGATVKEKVDLQDASSSERVLTRIVMFYSDMSFDEYKR